MDIYVWHVSPGLISVILKYNFSCSCMSLKAHYVKKSTYDGLPTSLYSISFQDMKVKIIIVMWWIVRLLLYNFSRASVIILMDADFSKGPSIWLLA